MGTRLRPRFAGLPSPSSYGPGLAQLAPSARRTGASLIRSSLRKLSAGRLRLAEPTAHADRKLNSTDSGGAWRNGSRTLKCFNGCDSSPAAANLIATIEFLIRITRATDHGATICVLSGWALGVLFAGHLDAGNRCACAVRSAPRGDRQAESFRREGRIRLAPVRRAAGASCARPVPYEEVEGSPA